MKLTYVPLLATLRAVYAIPRGREHFETYLNTVLNKDRSDIGLLPLLAANPMAKEHVTALLDDLLAGAPRGIGAGDRRGCRPAGGPARRVPGGPDRVPTTSRAGGPTGTPTSSTSGSGTARQQAVLGPDRRVVEQRAAGGAVREAVLTAIYRTALHAAARGPDEPAGHADPGGPGDGPGRLPGPTLDAEDIEYTREVLDPDLDATDKRTIMECLFGDGPGSTLGFSPRGLSPWAGLAVALHDAPGGCYRRVTAGGCPRRRVRGIVPTPVTPGGGGMSRSLVKAAAVGCSVLLAAGFVSYRAGAFDSLMPAHVARPGPGRTRPGPGHGRGPRPVESGEPQSVIFSSSKSIIIAPTSPTPPGGSTAAPPKPDLDAGVEVRRNRPAQGGRPDPAARVPVAQSGQVRATRCGSPRWPCRPASASCSSSWSSARWSWPSPRSRGQRFFRPAWFIDLCFFLGQYLLWSGLVLWVLTYFGDWLDGVGAAAVPPRRRRPAVVAAGHRGHPAERLLHLLGPPPAAPGRLPVAVPLRPPQRRAPRLAGRPPRAPARHRSTPSA